MPLAGMDLEAQLPQAVTEPPTLAVKIEPVNWAAPFWIVAIWTPW
jgi:hypothetical protein